MGKIAAIAYLPSMRITHTGGDTAMKGLRHIVLFIRLAFDSTLNMVGCGLDVRMGSASNLNKNDIALVLGASGFVGRHLTQLLQERGLIVWVVSRRPYSEARLDNIKESHWLTGNFGDPEIIKVACQGVAAVFHLANLSDASCSQKELLYKVNVLGAKEIVKAATAAGVSRLVYFSSALADDNPTSPYAMSKLRAESVLLAACRGRSEKNLHVTILRPANVYGPGMKGNIAGLIRRLRTAVYRFHS